MSSNPMARQHLVCYLGHPHHLALRSLGRLQTFSLQSLPTVPSPIHTLTGSRHLSPLSMPLLCPPQTVQPATRGNVRRQSLPQTRPQTINAVLPPKLESGAQGSSRRGRHCCTSPLACCLTGSVFSIPRMFCSLRGFIRMQRIIRGLRLRVSSYSALRRARSHRPFFFRLDPRVSSTGHSGCVASRNGETGLTSRQRRLHIRVRNPQYVWSPTSYGPNSRTNTIDPNTPKEVHLKVGRAINLVKRLDEWGKQCVSREVILRGWWPGTVEDNDQDSNNSVNGSVSLMKGRIKPGEKGKYCHRLERE
jgi:hypothetical protein